MSRVKRLAFFAIGAFAISSTTAWVLAPFAGEAALYEAGRKCGVSDSFLYYVAEQEDERGKLVAIDYATDGKSPDFACVGQELKRQGIRPIITQAIDNA
jgi:hypothetical protein